MCLINPHNTQFALNYWIHVSLILELIEKHLYDRIDSEAMAGFYFPRSKNVLRRTHLISPPLLCDWMHVRVHLPSAVSSILERLWPRLMPLTAGGRSILEPLSWAVEDDVTSGGTLFSNGEPPSESCWGGCRQSKTNTSVLLMKGLFTDARMG